MGENEISISINPEAVSGAESQLGYLIIMQNNRDSSGQAQATEEK